MNWGVKVNTESHWCIRAASCAGRQTRLRRNGFRVELIDTLDAASIHTKFNVPEKLEGCHTAVIGKHVFEGLIPAEYLKRVVSANRPIRGLAVPGMPVGAPGMPGTARGPINVYYLDDSATPKVFATF
jgi:hypothetical protein